MRLMVLVTGLLVFAAISIAVRYHFRSPATTRSFLPIAIASAVNIFAFARELSIRQKEPALLLLGLALIVAGASLFVWSMVASRAARLKLIFAADCPERILRAGPYRRIRHPFYSSYILYWSGCAFATLSPINIGYVAMLVPLLVFAARREEEGFERSPLAADYACYRRSTGLFWPRFRAGKDGRT